MNNKSINLNSILRICGRATSSLLQWLVQCGETSFRPEQQGKILIGISISIIENNLCAAPIPTYLHGSFDGHVLGNLVVVFHQVDNRASASVSDTHSPLLLIHGCSGHCRCRRRRGRGAWRRDSGDNGATHRAEDSSHRHALSQYITHMYIHKYYSSNRLTLRFTDETSWSRSSSSSTSNSSRPT